MNVELGNVIYVSDKNLGCKVFPNGAKKSLFYGCVLSDKALYFPNNPNAEFLAGACEPLTESERLIPFDDIEKVVYPTEDTKVWVGIIPIKRKGNAIMRIYRKSVDKYYDINIGMPEDTKKVYDLLMKQMGD